MREPSSVGSKQPALPRRTVAALRTTGYHWEHRFHCRARPPMKSLALSHSLPIVQCF